MDNYRVIQNNYEQITDYPIMDFSFTCNCSKTPVKSVNPALKDGVLTWKPCFALCTYCRLFFKYQSFWTAKEWKSLPSEIRQLLLACLFAIFKIQFANHVYSCAYTRRTFPWRMSKHYLTCSYKGFFNLSLSIDYSAIFSNFTFCFVCNNIN